MGDNYKIYLWDWMISDTGSFLPIINVKEKVDSIIVPRSEKIMVVRCAMKSVLIQIDKFKKRHPPPSPEFLEKHKQLYNNLEKELKKLTADPLDLSIDGWDCDFLGKMSESFHWALDGYHPANW